MGVKRFTFVATVFILVVSIFLILIQTNQTDHSTANIIQTAFYTTGAQVVTSEIYVRGRLKAEACDNVQKRQSLLTGILQNAGGNVNAVKPVFSEMDTDTGNDTQIDYIINDDISIHASVFREKQGLSVREGWVTVSLTNTSQTQELVKAAAYLESLLKNYSEGTTVNICITGSMTGTLDEGEVDAICGKILESAGASKVEGLYENDLVSVSAFSPSIGNTVKVNGKRINLNVAVRYNSYEGKTYIWLASPVITTEY
jgi:hypothetical protein